jgi:hypothetical protein
VQKLLDLLNAQDKKDQKAATETAAATTAHCCGCTNYSFHRDQQIVESLEVTKRFPRQG